MDGALIPRWKDKGGRSVTLLLDSQLPPKERKFKLFNKEDLSFATYLQKREAGATLKTSIACAIDCIDLRLEYYFGKKSGFAEKLCSKEF